jgi:putative Mg2+ transporter-C (MgtC) family protein
MDFLFETIASPRPLSLFSIILRIVVAIVFGGVIGFERGIKNRPAGMRTYMLVALGSAIVMMTNQYANQAYGAGDIVRMGAQVVSGIGFLGAGTIIVTHRNQIKGLTTAAGLWSAACMGLAVGLGLYELALVGGFMIFVVLTLLHNLDNRMRRRTRMVEIYVELCPEYSIGDFISYAHEKGIATSALQIEHDNVISGKGRAFVITLKSKSRMNHTQIIDTMKELEAISYIEEL